MDVGTVNFIFLIEKAPHPDGTIDADITHEQEFIERLEALEDDKVPFPETNKYGTGGQVLSTLANGKTEWVNRTTVEVYVDGETLYINTNVPDGNEVEY